MRHSDGRLPRRILLLLLTAGLAAACSPRPGSGPRRSTHIHPAPSAVAPRFRDISSAAGLDYRWRAPVKGPLDSLQTIGNGCAFLDYNGDGNLDILLVGPHLALYRGDGRGHFTNVSHQTGLDRFHGHFLGCAVGDYDNDGYEDIYISAYQGGMLLHNLRGQQFVDVTRRAGIAPQPWGTSCAFADVDNDGKLDLFIGNYLKFDATTPPPLLARRTSHRVCARLLRP